MVFEVVYGKEQGVAAAAESGNVSDHHKEHQGQKSAPSCLGVKRFKRTNTKTLGHQEIEK